MTSAHLWRDEDLVIWVLDVVRYLPFINKNQVGENEMC